MDQNEPNQPHNSRTNNVPDLNEQLNSLQPRGPGWKTEENNKSFSDETWSNAVKSNISKKLEKIPVIKALLNQKGQGCIVLPNKDTCTSAKILLEKDFEVTQEMLDSPNHCK